MKKTNNRTGLTIVEVMVATMVLALVMASAFPLVDQLLARINMTRDHYVAATLCQGRIERSKSVPYIDLPMLAESGVLLDDLGNDDTAGRFRRSTVVEVDVPEAGMTQMTVRIDLCICSRWGWRRYLHPVKSGRLICQFTEEHEEMVYLFTEYKNR